MEAKKRTRKRERYTVAPIISLSIRGDNRYCQVSKVDTLWYSTLLSEKEWIEDINHKEYYTLDKQGKQFLTLHGTMTRLDRGSPMQLRRASRYWPRSGASTLNDAWGKEGRCLDYSRASYSGSQICNSSESGITTSGSVRPTYGILPSTSVMKFSSLSPKAWRKFKPTNPKVSTSQFIGELHDLPRNPLKLLEDAKFFRMLGSQYLNWEFGWRPFVNDLKEFLQLYLDFGKRYEQLVRDNGKPVRRSGNIFQDIDSSQTEVKSYTYDRNSPVLAAWAYASPDRSSREFTTTTISQKYWFSGRFRYYLAPMGSLRYTEQISRILYGLDLTPSLVWELMPWSWLIDWFVNVGDNIANMTDNSLDGLVADYAYTMGHYKSEQVLTSIGPLSTCSFVSTVEIKAREQATPYGFGLNPSSFTGRQKAILAALLLARS